MVSTTLVKLFNCVVIMTVLKIRNTTHVLFLSANKCHMKVIKRTLGKPLAAVALQLICM